MALLYPDGGGGGGAVDGGDGIALREPRTNATARRPRLGPDRYRANYNSIQPYFWLQLVIYTRKILLIRSTSYRVAFRNYLKVCNIALSRTIV